MIMQCTLIFYSNCHQDGGLRRSKRVRLKEEAKMEDPWKLLDPHDPVSTSDSNRPFKKGMGVVYNIVSNIAQRGTTVCAYLFHMLLHNNAYEQNTILACMGTYLGYFFYCIGY